MFTNEEGGNAVNAGYSYSYIVVVFIIHDYPTFNLGPVIVSF